MRITKDLYHDAMETPKAIRVAKRIFLFVLALLILCFCSCANPGTTTASWKEKDPSTGAVTQSKVAVGGEALAEDIKVTIDQKKGLITLESKKLRTSKQGVIAKTYAGRAALTDAYGNAGGKVVEMGVKAAAKSVIPVP